MKTKILCLFVLSSSFLQMSPSQIETTSRAVSVENSFPIYNYQDNAKNYFLGNSVYEIKRNMFTINQSLCLKKTKTNRVTMVLEFDKEITDEGLSSFEINMSISDPVNDNNSLNQCFKYSNIMDLSLEQLDYYDFWTNDNCLFLNFYCGEMEDKFIINGTDSENPLYVKIDSTVDYKLTRFLMDDHKLLDDNYFHYEYTPPEIGDYVNFSKIRYNNDSYTLNSNISKPFTIEEIKQNIKAYDYGDNQEISINVQDHGYQEGIDNFTLGSYNLDLVATDSKNNQSILNLIVNLVDIDAPNISLKSGDKIKIPVSICEEIGCEIDLNQYVNILDNYDQNMRLDNGYNTVKYEEIGTKTLTLKATDSSKNNSQCQVQVEFYDDIKPSILGDSTISILPYQYKDAKSILDQKYNITDNYKLSEIGIKDDTFSSNFSKAGTYNFTIYAIDAYSNLSEKTITVIVEDASGPVFFIDEISLNLYTNSQYLSAREMVNMLISQNKIEKKNYKIVEYTDNTYSENYQNPGKYQVTIACYDENLNRDFIQINLNVKKEKAKKKNFFARIGDFFRKIGQAIKNFFDFIKNKIMNLF